MHRHGADPRDPFFARNTFGITSCEFMWGLALPLVLESTFLQLFLRHLGASHTVIGFIPAIFASGNAVFSILASFLTSHLTHKRRAVIIAHIACAIPFVIFGLYYLIAPRHHSAVAVFLFCYAAFCAALGVVYPVWMSFLVKIFSPRKTLPALSIMMLTQIASRLIASIFIVSIVKKFAFSPQSSAAIFIFTGFVFALGAGGFLFVKEINVHTGEKRNAHSVRSFVRAAKDVMSNRNFVRFFASGIEASVVATIISFFATYAVEFRNINPSAAAGLFAGVIYTGSILSNIIMGWFDILPIKRKFMLSRSCGTAAIIMLIFANNLTLFIVASFLIGIERGVQQLAYAPAVKTLSGRHDATDHFAIAQLLSLPFSFGIPVATGLMIEKMHRLGALSYQIAFSFLAVAAIAGVILLIKTGFPQRQHSATHQE